MRPDDDSESIQSMGGKARAKVLTSEQRKHIATKAAETRWALPRESHTAEMQIGGWAMRCGNLYDGRRVVSQRSLMQLLGMRGRGDDTGHRIVRLLDNPALKSAKINDLALAIRTPIKYTAINGFTAYGYEGELLVEFCKALLDARRAGAISGEVMNRYASNAEMFLVSIAKVGIVALIDEATGFQEFRDRNALEALLDKYLNKELAAWMKRFPDDYYKEVFRLMGWEWKGMQVNRPSYVGKITRDIVYQRLAPGIIHELEQRNPIDENGRRKAKHHQWLTDDVGHPALAQHLYAVISLMKASATYMQFKRMLQKALPKKGENIQHELFGEDTLEGIEQHP